VLQVADTRLTQLRSGGVPDAGTMVIASDQKAARAYAALLTKLTGETPTVVLSDDPGSSNRIAEYSAGTGRWMVAVRMVSEGVDVPRLAVGVYATSASTPLFFAQAIGRYVRSRRSGETASIFLPSVPTLLDLASQMEAQLDHVLGKPHRESLGDDEPVERRRSEPTGRQRLRVAGRRRRVGPGHRRRFVVRRRDASRQ
jgi:superfamily II DNA or RNA helicase